MKVGYARREGFVDLPQAGKKRGLHSPAKGIELIDRRKRTPEGVTHDYSHVFGWNQRDKK